LDEEDDDWHEDGYKWNLEQRKRRAAREARTKSKDKNRGRKMSSNNILAQAHATQGMKMGFVRLRVGWCGRKTCTKEEADAQGKKFGALIRTGGIRIMTTAVERDKILVVESEGRFHDVQAFMLSQPEVWTWSADSDEVPAEGLTLPRDSPYLRDGASSRAKKTRKKGKRKKIPRKQSKRRRAAPKESEL
jgi:hypothetical protein